MGNKQSQKDNEKIVNPFIVLDNMKIKENPLTHLKFYSNFEEEFPFLRHLLLSDYMNLLNGFHVDGQKHEENCEETLSKENWMRFFDLKILQNPLITRLNTSQVEITQQKQLWDDIFDDVKEYYNMTNQLETNYIPKSIFFAVGFLYCINRKSQKIIIMLNLFNGKDNSIVMDGNLYAFFYLIYVHLLFSPLRCQMYHSSLPCTQSNSPHGGMVA